MKRNREPDIGLPTNSPLAEVWRRLKKNKPAMIGLILFSMILLACLCADLIVPVEMTTQTNPLQALQPPSAEHLFGTDQLGRDIFARVLHGSRPSLLIGIAATLICTVLGVLLGGVVGYYGGFVDNVIMRIMDVIQCIPSTLLLIVLLTVMGDGTLNLLLAMTIGAIPGTVRMVRAIVLGLANSDYIQSAKSYGMSEFVIIVKHLLPNAAGQIIVAASSLISSMILSIASVSFLGYGIKAPAAEWGIMVAESQSFMRSQPWVTLFPGLAIVLTALSVNLIGDGLRDAFDPKLKT